MNEHEHKPVDYYRVGCPTCGAPVCCEECCKQEYNTYKSNLCPLTNSSHEKALVRVVEKRLIYTKGDSEMIDRGTGEVIQVLCSCGHIISENEIKSK